MSDPKPILQEALGLLKPFVRWTKENQPDLVTVSVSRHELLSAVEILVGSGWYLSAITGLHLPGGSPLPGGEKQWLRTSTELDFQSGPIREAGSFLVLYQFCKANAVITLRVHPPSLSDADVPSICGIIPSATLYERELIEMFGITVISTPDTSRFLLPDDWPDGIYPLRKE